jgi:transcriptional regulator with XRE-family HTH domain
MAKEYTSVSEMLADSSADDSLKQDTADRIASRQVIKRLLALRVARGVSQSDVAKKMGCTQSRISKLENGIDDDIRLGDLHKYLDALDHDMSLFVCKKDWQSFQQIKFCAVTIRRCLGRLVDLAGDDPEIEHGVSKAHVETLVNLVKFVVDSAKDLPSFPSMIPGIIEANGTDDSDLESEIEMPEDEPAVS